MKTPRDIIWRLRLIYLTVGLFAIMILFKAIKIGVIDREHWLDRKEMLTMKFDTIEPIRGNIYSSDGRLLATSLPIYDIRVDLKAGGITDKIFYGGIDSLALGLNKIFSDKPVAEYKRNLTDARKNGNRYYLLKKDVGFAQLKEMKSLPILRLGRYKGGMIVVQRSKREMPFRHLASRTLGRYQKGIKPVGIEGAYNEYLQGVGGKRLMQKISGNIWKPVNEENELEPEEGADIISTIDVNIQDVAETELMNQLQKHGAEFGCAVLMEVETGYVRAIANLSRSRDSSYRENLNYAILQATEPGSTFKLASLVALIEDNLARTSDSVKTGNGTYRFGDRIMRDSHEGGYGTITLGRAFELSSNVGISKVVHQAYSKNPQLFIDRLRSMNLGNPLGIDLPGESSPYIKDPKSESWSGVSLPWMSIGYESKQTPLQTLAFYNAIANNGKLVKPQFVQEIRKKGEIIMHYEPVVINEAICSQRTIDAVKPVLEGVVENGTAKNLRNAHFKIAGKTGTAQIASGKAGYTDQGSVRHQASFVGYFPADKPKYTCIVLISAPSSSVYYGNLVAGPVFKEIADKVYAKSLEMHEPINPAIASEVGLPIFKGGYQSDLKALAQALNLAFHVSDENIWVKPIRNQEQLQVKALTLEDGRIPDVTGLGLRDALHLLENCGLRVKVKGKGFVRHQSIPAGTMYKKDQEIFIELV